MSKKTELIQIFSEYKRKYEELQLQVDNISKSEAYTEQGKAEEIKRIVDGFAPTVQIYHDMAATLIEKATNELASKWKNNSVSKLLDSGYQAGLSNVIKMFEVGAITTKDDISSILETYQGDFNAMAVISKMISNSNDENVRNCSFLVPADNREKNKQLLSQLRNNVDAYINVGNLTSDVKSWNRFNQGLSGVSMSLVSMSEFVNTRLGDDLELVPQV